MVGTGYVERIVALLAANNRVLRDLLALNEDPRDWACRSLLVVALRALLSFFKPAMCGQSTANLFTVTSV